ncbi:MAG: hypothetical protein CBB97_01605 [Candidatus Endolissoclinum sp. TMED37]|nr:MAG: hypothetical protein CBB97_01605 [Candidatus Endolissoclinum sp. TMED37]
MKIFTIIKNNSVRIPGKNFINLGNKPLWEHLVSELSNHELYINTDSKKLIDEIQNNSKFSHCRLIKRSQKHIDWENNSKINTSPVSDMFSDFLNDYVDDLNEPIVLTHVTSPFLKSATIVNAKNKLSSKYKSVHSVGVIKDFAWLKTKNTIREINFDKNVVQLTQDLDPLYISKGAFFIISKKTFIEHNNRISPNNYFYPLSHIEGIEIDTFEDLEFANVVYKGIKNGVY